MLQVWSEKRQYYKLPTLRPTISPQAVSLNGLYFSVDSCLNNPQFQYKEFSLKKINQLIKKRIWGGTMAWAYPSLEGATGF